MSGLTNIPQFDCNGALGYLAHVKAHSGNHVFVEGPAGNHVDKGGLARVLQTDQG